MSSHREAPQISQDPVADSTDLYAFVSPDNPTFVTILACYVPLQSPDGGPNFYEFGSDVLYEIKINNKGNGSADLVYQFKFTTTMHNPGSFLYNTGPITSLTAPTWNRRQTYSVTKVKGTRSTVLAKTLPCPPCNIGPLSTPKYTTLVNAAIHTLPSNQGKVFAGQRADGFYVDLGAIFTLGILRPFAGAHTTFSLPGVTLVGAPGINSLKSSNVHVIALQVPIVTVTESGTKPTVVATGSSVIGVWTTASRQKSRIQVGHTYINSGPYTQVSRLGNPLVNEAIIPMGSKDLWNTQNPTTDSQYVKSFSAPELSTLLPTLYPGAFTNLAAYNKKGQNRADIVAILLTGLPGTVIPGFFNYTGPTQSDMLRLNLAIPPTTKTPSNLGLLGTDLAGYPNGRRVFDDVTTIELKALAGATLKLVDPTFTPDAVVATVTPGLTSKPTDTTAKGTESYLTSFPYLGVPHQGYTTPDAP